MDKVSIFILSTFILMNTSTQVMTLKKIGLCKMKTWKAVKNKTLPLGSQSLKFTIKDNAALMKMENNMRYCFKGLLYIVEKDKILLLLYKRKLTKLVNLFI